MSSDPSDLRGFDLDSWIDSVLEDSEERNSEPKLEDSSPAIPAPLGPANDTSAAKLSPVGPAILHLPFAQPAPANTISLAHPASPAPETVCWGAQLMALLPGDVQRKPCDGAFVPGKNHFKNKFCSSCQTGLLVPASHVLAMNRLKRR